MNQVKEHINDTPQVRESLNNKSVGILGAEASLRKKLEKIEAEKSTLKTHSRPTAAKSSSPAATAVVTPETKKSTKRDNEKTPEAKESEDWVKVTP